MCPARNAHVWKCAHMELRGACGSVNCKVVVWGNPLSEKLVAAECEGEKGLTTTTITSASSEDGGGEGGIKDSLL